MERVDLGPYKYVDVNITGFRMVDPSTPEASRYVRKWDYVASELILEEEEDEEEEFHFSAREGAKGKSHPLYLANALVFDAVHVLANALDEIATMEGFTLGRPNCDQPRPWVDGEKIMRQIRKVGGRNIKSTVLRDSTM